MKDDRWANGACFLERALSRIGDPWTMLILRDISCGLSRFDEFRVHLGIASNMLSQKLASLSDAGIIDREPYQEHPPRYRYFLTERGRDFLPVLHVMGGWGRRHFVDPVFVPDRLEHRTVVVIDESTGRPVERDAPVWP